MAVCLHRLRHTSKACADSAGHSLLQRDIGGDPLFPRELLYCAQHGHRAACTDHVRSHGRFPYRVQDISLCPDASVLRGDQKFAVLLQFLCQEQIAVSVSHNGCHYGSGSPREGRRQFNHGRDPYPASEEKDSLSREFLQVIPVSEDSQHVHTVAGPLRSQRGGSRPCHTEYKLQLACVRIPSADTDGPWQKL